MAVFQYTCQKRLEPTFIYLAMRVQKCYGWGLFKTEKFGVRK